MPTPSAEQLRNGDYNGLHESPHRSPAREVLQEEVARETGRVLCKIHCCPLYLHWCVLLGEHCPLLLCQSVRTDLKLCRSVMVVLSMGFWLHNCYLSKDGDPEVGFKCRLVDGSDSQSQT